MNYLWWAGVIMRYLLFHTLGLVFAQQMSSPAIERSDEKQKAVPKRRHVPLPLVRIQLDAFAPATSWVWLCYERS